MVRRRLAFYGLMKRASALPLVWMGFGALNSYMGRCATRSPLCLPGDVRDRDIERSRTSVARDGQLNGVSNANVLQNVDEIGHAVHWLAVRVGDNDPTSAEISTRALHGPLSRAGSA